MVVSDASAFLPYSTTSAWFSSVLLIPAARLVQTEIAARSSPQLRAAMASGTVLIPTRLAPRMAAMRTSAGVS